MKPLSRDAEMLLNAIYVLSKGVAGVEVQMADCLRLCEGKTLTDMRAMVRKIVNEKEKN